MDEDAFRASTQNPSEPSRRICWYYQLIRYQVTGSTLAAFQPAWVEYTIVMFSAPNLDRDMSTPQGLYTTISESLLRFTLTPAFWQHISDILTRNTVALLDHPHQLHHEVTLNHYLLKLLWLVPYRCLETHSTKHHRQILSKGIGRMLPSLVLCPLLG